MHTDSVFVCVCVCVKQILKGIFKHKDFFLTKQVILPINSELVVVIGEEAESADVRYVLCL